MFRAAVAVKLCALLLQQLWRTDFTVVRNGHMPLPFTVFDGPFETLIAAIACAAACRCVEVFFAWIDSNIKGDRGSYWLGCGRARCSGDGGNTALGCLVVRVHADHCALDVYQLASHHLPFAKGYVVNPAPIGPHEMAFCVQGWARLVQYHGFAKSSYGCARHQKRL